MSRFLALALFLPTLLSAQTAADTSPRTITVDEAVRLARRNSPLAVQARGDLRVARAGIKSAYFAFVPTAGVSLGTNWRRGLDYDPRTDSIYTNSNLSFSNGVGFRVDLFDGGRRFFDLRAAKAQRDVADASEVLQEYQIALDVKQQYYDVLAAREAEEAARAQLAEAEQQLRVSTVRVAAGAASRSDSLRSVVTVGNARLAILDAQNRVQLANASLTRLVGTSFPVTAAPEDVTEPAPEMLDQAQLLAMAERGPVVDQAGAQLSAARAQSRSALTAFLPTISASAQRGGAGFDRRFGLDGPYTYVSTFNVSLSFPILNGLQREENVVRANVAADNAEAQLRDAHLRAQQELTQALGLFRNAGQRVAVQLVSVAATEEDLRLQQQRYALGAASVLDVLTSQSALNQARNSLITARFDQRVARARLEALIGRPLTAER
jgi:outer membrane protein